MGLFSKKRIEGEWVNEGWTTVQQANPERHILEIVCRTENGMVVEVRTRHSHGEEAQGIVTVDGKDVLPLSIKEFTALYEKGKMEIK
ncbi:MAG: hypothetical protein KBS52_01120 [Clostridiales bacterium]|nr:hypothetical protein [Candidatus Equinaster intestinalis]